MSVVSFTLKEKEYSFKCEVQLTDESKAEEDLHILVQQWMKSQTLKGSPVNIKMVDDKGSVASIANFRERGTLRIILPNQ